MLRESGEVEKVTGARMLYDYHSAGFHHSRRENQLRHLLEARMVIRGQQMKSKLRPHVAMNLNTSPLITLERGVAQFLFHAPDKLSLHWGPAPLP